MPSVQNGITNYSLLYINNLEKNIKIRKGDGSLDRLVCEWKEIMPSGDIHNHIYSAGIDKNREIYLDCRKRLVFTKILISTIARPLHGVVKTAYHLAMIPVAKAIIRAFKGEITPKKALILSVRSIKDIVRTPIYETAILVVGLTALLVAPVAPSTLYHFRKIIGRLEAALFRGPLKTFTLTPCFQATQAVDFVGKLSLCKEGELRNFEDTDYGENSLKALKKAKVITSEKRKNGTFWYKIKKFGELDANQAAKLRKFLVNRSIIHYGRRMIKTRRKNYNPFYQVCGRLNPEVTFVSASYDKVISKDGLVSSVSVDNVRKPKKRKQKKTSEAQVTHKTSHKKARNKQPTQSHKTGKTSKSKNLRE